MTVAALQFLARHMSWLAHRPEAPEAFDELHDAIAHVERTIDTAPARVYLGPCDVCRRDVYAKPGDTIAHCRPCAIPYEVNERRDWLLRQAEDRLERAVDVCRALAGWGITVSRHTLKMWEVRGRLIAKGQDAAGRPLYRVGDVVEVATHDAARRADTG